MSNNLSLSKCRRETAALLVIDLQERLGAAMPGKVLNRVLQNAELLARSAGLLGIPALWAEQYPQGLGPTYGALASALPAGCIPLPKTTFSCMGNPAFVSALDALEGRRQLVIVGMEAHVCVVQTAIDLAARGHEVFVVEDAICSRRLENYQNALARMQRLGMSVVSAESVVFEWLGDSRHPCFKAVQSLLR